MVRAFRQSKRQDSRADVKRQASIARRGFAFRSTKSPELFTQKQVLGRDGGGGPDTEFYKGQRVQKNGEDATNHVQKRWHDSILLTH